MYENVFQESDSEMERMGSEAGDAREAVGGWLCHIVAWMEKERNLMENITAKNNNGTWNNCKNGNLPQALIKESRGEAGP